MRTPDARMGWVEIPAKLNRFRGGIPQGRIFEGEQAAEQCPEVKNWQGRTKFLPAPAAPFKRMKICKQFMKALDKPHGEW